jgi:fumarate hydratase subunit alpha
MACVFLEIGEAVHIEGDIKTAVDEGVRRGYTSGFLRKSIVSDPLRRINSGDNTPAMLYIDIVPGASLTITVAPKGAGSENMSRIKMLSPSDGREGIIDFVVSTVREAGPNPCPPIIVGVGIGGNFDKAALLAKKALLRPLDSKNKDPFYSALEDELLLKINDLGIGPQGFGGLTTALAVSVETNPTHIASLPCAVNINCHVARHAKETL